MKMNGVDQQAAAATALCGAFLCISGRKSRRGCWLGGSEKTRSWDRRATPYMSVGTVALIQATSPREVGGGGK